MATETAEKVCFRCEQSKPLTEFYENSGMTSGRINKCKRCFVADAQAYRRRNKSYPWSPMKRLAARLRALPPDLQEHAIRCMDDALRLVEERRAGSSKEVVL